MRAKPSWRCFGTDKQPRGQARPGSAARVRGLMAAEATCLWQGHLAGRLSVALTPRRLPPSLACPLAQRKSRGAVWAEEKCLSSPRPTPSCCGWLACQKGTMVGRGAGPLLALALSGCVALAQLNRTPGLPRGCECHMSKDTSRQQWLWGPGSEVRGGRKESEIPSSTDTTVPEGHVSHTGHLDGERRRKRLPLCFSVISNLFFNECYF